MLLLVGLGNPGPQYAYNRHNIGFMAVDEIHGHGRFTPFRKKFQGELADGVLAGHKVLLLKPATFMNASGRAVQAAMAFYRLGPQDVIVFHDELDLAGGKVRVKQGGGHAGHNGLRSLHAHIGADFKRVRLGIGHPGSKEKVVGHVLKDFSKEDRLWLGPLLDAVGKDAPLLLEGRDSDFMSQVSRSVPKPASAQQKPSTEETNRGV